MMELASQGVPDKYRWKRQNDDDFPQYSQEISQLIQQRDRLRDASIIVIEEVINQQDLQRLQQLQKQCIDSQQQNQQTVYMSRMEGQQTVYYKGGWSNSQKKQGYGHQVLQINRTRQVYSGGWQNDSKHGWGEEISRYENEVYIGEWQDNKKHGWGKQKQRDGGIYLGQWEDDRKHGWGYQYYQNGTLYIGLFKEGYRHGYGYMYDQSNDIYLGQFSRGCKHGEGEQLMNDRSKFKGLFKCDLRQGRGQRIQYNNCRVRIENGVWSYGIFKSNDKKKQRYLQFGEIGQFTKIQRYVSLLNEPVQELLNIMKYSGKWNNYQEIGKTNRVIRVFQTVYVGLGQYIRPLFVTFVGPFLPFANVFWNIKSESDKQCGSINTLQLYYIFGLALVGFNCGQILTILVIVFGKFTKLIEQLKELWKLLKYKVQIKMYNKRQMNWDKYTYYLKRNNQQVYTDRLQTNNNNMVQQYDSFIQNNQSEQANPQASIQKMYAKVKKYHDKREGVKKYYGEIRSIRENISRQQNQCNLNYVRAIEDIFVIINCIRFDIDFLTDSIAIKTCYVLSQSRNFSENKELNQYIRTRLYQYYISSLVVFFLSMVPKFNCYIFLMLRWLVNKLNMIKIQEADKDGQQQIELLVNYNTKWYKKILFHLYCFVSKLYGIKYQSRDQYGFRSFDIEKDVKRFFYVNHEDYFTAQQMAPNQQPENNICYNEAKKNVNCGLRVSLFRLVFENIPQLCLQIAMTNTLQSSELEDCKKKKIAFYLSILMTSISIGLGVLNLLLILFKKTYYSKLGILEMVNWFKLYLNMKSDDGQENESTIRIDNKIEFKPKMMEALYQFMIENQRYNRIVFGSHVQFKGSANQYFKVAYDLGSQTLLDRTISILFEGQQNEGQQNEGQQNEGYVLAELAMKKIFGDSMFINVKQERKRRRKYCLSVNERYYQCSVESGFSFNEQYQRCIPLINNNQNDMMMVELAEQIDLEYSDQSVGSIIHISRILQQQNRQLLVRITSQTFDYHLLYGLFQLKEVIGQLQFQCTNGDIMLRNVKKWQQHMSNIVEQMGGQCFQLNQVDMLRNIRQVLEDMDLKVVIKYAEHILDYRNQFNGDAFHRFDEVRDLVSTEQMCLKLSRGDDTDIQILRQFNDRQIGFESIILSNFQLNYRYNPQLFDLIQRIKERQQVHLQLNLYKQQGNREQSSMSALMIERELSFSRISIYYYPSNIQNLDELINRSVNQENINTLFRGLEQIEYVFNQFTSDDHLRQLMEVDTQSEYQSVKTVVIQLQENRMVIQLVIDFIQHVCIIYQEIKQVVIKSNFTDKCYESSLFEQIQSNKPEQLEIKKEQIYYWIRNNGTSSINDQESIVPDESVFDEEQSINNNQQ